MTPAYTEHSTCPCVPIKIQDTSYKCVLIAIIKSNPSFFNFDCYTNFDKL